MGVARRFFGFIQATLCFPGVSLNLEARVKTELTFVWKFEFCVLVLMKYKAGMQRPSS